MPRVRTLMACALPVTGKLVAAGVEFDVDAATARRWIKHGAAEAVEGKAATGEAPPAPAEAPPQPAPAGALTPTPSASAGAPGLVSSDEPRSDTREQPRRRRRR